MSDSSKDPFTAAMEQGLDVVVPQPDELFIDLDNDADIAHFKLTLPILQRFCEAVEYRRTISKGGNLHAYVRVKWPVALHPATRIALQACLGSDRKRDLLSLIELTQGTPWPTVVFFEVPNTESVADA